MAKPKLPQLSESVVRAGSTPQSFARGEELYRAGAVTNASVQENIFIAHCEGSMEPYYRVTIELDDAGILNASCTCAYDYGGYCKHIVAVLLTYIHNPKSFHARPAPRDLLAELSRDELAALLQKLLARDPELYDWVEAQIAQPGARTKQKTRAKPLDAEVYRRQVRNVLHSLDGTRASDAYWNMGGLANGLREIAASAQKFLDAGDAATAHTILMALVEEFADSHAFDYLDDSDGELGSVMDDVGVPLAETILSMEWSEKERTRIAEKLKRWKKELGDYGAEGNLQVAIDAATFSWGDANAPRVESAAEDEYDDEAANENEYDDEEWSDEAVSAPDTNLDLVEAKLNVLARQERVDEYLALCKKYARHLRYALKLCELGRVTEGVNYALENFGDTSQALTFAQWLREAKYVSEALTIAEAGLKLGGNKFALGQWLAPLEETQGRDAQGLNAWLAAFTEQPSLEIYKRIKALGAQDWNTLEPRVMDALNKSWDKRALAQVLLYEQRWDEAIKIAEGRDVRWDGIQQLVAEAVIAQRPEWVIRISKKNAEMFIAEKESKYYARAAEWLERAKKAYEILHQHAEWLAYLNRLKEEFKRRPALQTQLKRL